MKKLLTIVMMTAAVSAMAVESSNTFGILRVDSSAAQTIVSVPWVAAGGGDINIKDVVKTANLTEGDTLYYYDGSGFKMWQLGASGWDIAQDAQGNKPNAELARGGAIILVRQHPEVGSFYLYGQYASDAVSTSCVADGHTLLAPPTTTGDANGKIDLNSVVTEGEINTNDRIAVPVTNNGVQSLALLRYNTTDKKWGIKKSAWDYTVAKIPVGTGVWYVSAGGSPTFNWTATAE